MKLPFAFRCGMTVLLAVCIFCVAPVLAQTINTFAGTGIEGFSGDGAAAISAMLDHPRGIAFDAAGNAYIADEDNNRIRKISTTGIITTFAGTGVAGYNGDNIAAVSAQLNQPEAVIVDASGNVYIADSQNRRIRKVNTSGTITTIAGTGVEGYSGDGGPAVDAMLHRAVSLAFDKSGNLYFADSVGARIRMISTSGAISTVAGNGIAGYSGDGSLAVTAQLATPTGVAVDSAGNVYIADADNQRIRKVSNGIIITLAGNGTEGFAGDGGSATGAELNEPEDVKVSSSGAVYIADTSNNRVRVVVNGNITTVAGTGQDTFSGDGGLAINAALDFPWSLGLDAAGNLYVGDRVNERVRIVTFTVLGSPVLPPESVVNGASFAPATSANGAVAAGAIVSIFGTNLASGTALAGSTPLPTTLADATVTFNGVAAPLFFVSPSQINAQVPVGINAGLANVQVTRGTQASASQQVGIAAFSPGIFTVNRNGAGDGAILHGSNFTLVSAGNPAMRGEAVAIFAAGLGSVNPFVASGTVAPSNPPMAQTQATPTVTIAGLPATILFSGMAPGFVGLYQINVQVPADVPSGSQTLQVSINGTMANAVTLSIQ